MHPRARGYSTRAPLAGLTAAFAALSACAARSAPSPDAARTPVAARLDASPPSRATNAASPPDLCASHDPRPGAFIAPENLARLAPLVRFGRRFRAVQLSDDGGAALLLSARRALLIDPSRLPDETSAVRCAALGEDAFLAPNGALFAVWESAPFFEAPYTGRVHIVRARDCALVATAQTIVATPRAAAFSPDGTTLAIAGSSDRNTTLHAFRSRDGAAIGAPLRIAENRIEALAFSPDGARLAAVTATGQTRILRANDLTQLAVYEHSRAGVNAFGRAAAFSPDGHVVTAFITSRAHQWGPLEVSRDGEAPWRVSEPLGMPSDVWFSSDARFVGLAREIGPSRRIEGFSLADRTRTFTHAGWRLAWSGDGERAAIVDDGSVTFWNAHGTALAGAISARPGGLAAFSGPGALLPADWAESSPSFAWLTHTARSRVGAWGGWLSLTRGRIVTPDGRYALRLVDGGLAVSVQGERGAPRVMEPFERLAVWSEPPAFSPDGALVAIGLKAGDVAIRALSDGDLVRTLTRGGSEAGVSGDVRGTYWSADGRFVTATTNACARTWRMPEGEWLGDVCPAGVDAINAWAVSSDGRTCAATRTARTSTTTIYRLPAGEVVRALPTESPMALSRDGRVLAASAAPDRLDLWDVASGERLRRLHQPATDGLAFSPDGALLFVHADTSEGSVAWGVPRVR